MICVVADNHDGIIVVFENLSDYRADCICNSVILRNICFYSGVEIECVYVLEKVVICGHIEEIRNIYNTSLCCKFVC